MIILDAQALVAHLRGEPAGAEVRDIFRAGDVGITAVNLAESITVLRRRFGLPVEEIQAAISMLSTVIEVTPIEERHAWRAAEIRAQHYHRTRRPISTADSILLAAASSEDRVATADRHLLAVADLAGVSTVRLPAS